MDPFLIPFCLLRPQTISWRSQQTVLSVHLQTPVLCWSPHQPLHKVLDYPPSVPRHAMVWERVGGSAMIDRGAWSVEHV